MSALPNPWLSDAPLYGVGPCMTFDLPIIRAHNERKHAEIVAYEADHRFTLDHDRFLADIEAAPTFLSDPRPEYLSATDMMPVLEVLAGY